MAITEAAKRLIELGVTGSYGLSRDVLKHHVYDTWDLPAAVADHTYFQQQIGQPYAGGVKTSNETNMTDAGKMPNGQTFLIQGMQIKILTPIDPLVASSPIVASIPQYALDVIRNSTFKIVVVGREFDYYVPGSAFVPSIAASGSVAIATDYYASYGSFISNGKSSLGPTPIFLDQLVGFSVTQEIGSADANVVTKLNTALTALEGDDCAIQIILDGILTRAK